MTSSSTVSLAQLFHCPHPKHKKYVQSLIHECQEKIGEKQIHSLLNEWHILSKKFLTIKRFNSLKDKNHRLLLIEYLKNQAAKEYSYSYFNNAKIDSSHIQYLRQFGPFHFSQIIIIVSQMKLIYRYYKQKLIWKQSSENHIDMTITRILELCKTKKRNINSNLNKFKCITQFQENRQELIKQLGKMLRKSWALQKRYAKQVIQVDINERSASQKDYNQLLQIQSLNDQRFFSILDESNSLKNYI